MNAPNLDPRTVPLSGLQLIEASAGTGKTFNLAGLYLRLVVERGANVRDILVMTFTKAATQELRERIRRRLVDAARIAHDPAAAIDGDPEHDFARFVIDAADEPRERVARRLTDAAAGVDEATIVTIHGFAQRAAADNAFDSAQAFDRGEIVDDRIVRTEAAADLWRQSIIGTSGNAALLDVWPTPDALYKDVAPILSRPNISVDGADESAFAEALRMLWSVWQREKAALETAITEALEAGAFKKSGMQTLLANYTNAADFISTLDTRLKHAFETGEPPVLPQALAELADPWQFIAKNSKAKKACGAAFEELTLGAPLTDLVTRAHVVRSARAAGAIATLAARRKIEWRQFSYDDLVLTLRDALVDDDRGPRLAAALREQWPYALVDEFQDTDPLQYDSLKRTYLADDAEPGDTALLLIGDPKQAIYAFRGGDIHAYLAAARAAGDARYTLSTNYRSSPAVLEAVAGLFQTPKDTPFLEAGIGFPAVDAGRTPGDRRLVYRDDNGGEHTQPALTVWQFTGGSGTKGDDEAAMVHRTVAAVAGMLADGAAWQSDDSAWNRAVAPRDIAILVNSNHQAATLQIALAEHGVAAVCQRRDSIFASDEARDLVLLLTALARPDDARAVKSAETTQLAGARLADIVALAEDDAALQTRVARYQAHHQHWRDRGVLAALEAVFVAAGPAILALTDGERRMSNYLQLGELLAEAEPECYGMDGLVHWLDRAIAETDDANGHAESGEEALLRLESDDALVRIATVHSAKGLEYPIVFLPFAAFLGAPTGNKNPTKPPYVYHDTDSPTPERVRIDLKGANDKAQARAVTEFHAESLRLLYVALTRAADALFITWREPGDGTSTSAGNSARHTALDQLLGRGDASVGNMLAGLTRKHANVMTIETIDTDAPRLAIPTVTGDTSHRLTGGRDDLPAPRTPWSSWSFSRLAHAPAGQAGQAAPSAPLPGAEDEWAAATPVSQSAANPNIDSNDDELPLPTLDRALAGVGFGSAIHDLLEHAVFHGWPAPGAAADDKTRKRTADTLRRYGLTGNAREESSRVDQSIALVARTLQSPLPTIGPLADVASNRMLAEMGFLLGMGDQRLATVVDAARRAGYLQALLARSATLSLNGLLQGFIDLVVEIDGAYWILDYKTNRLGDTPAAYETDALAAAIGASHYDLQYLLYTVALHRHLRGCLADYDPGRHLGGVQYLFVRAMDGQTTRGVYRDRPPTALIETLDALFDAKEPIA